MLETNCFSSSLFLQPHQRMITQVGLIQIKAWKVKFTYAAYILTGEIGAGTKPANELPPV